MSVDRRCFYLKTDSGHVGSRHSVARVTKPYQCYLKSSLLGDSEGLQIEANVRGCVASSGVATVGTWLWVAASGTSRLMTHVADGHSVAHLSQADRLRSYVSLAENLKRLHSIPTQGAGYIVATNPLRGAFDTWREYLMSYFDTQAMYAIKQGLLSNEEAVMIGYHCGSVYWDGEPRLLHGDLSDRNLFAANGEITAIIDWEDALAGDPVFDLAYWATHHPCEEWSALFDAYPYSPDRTFWAYYLRIALSKLVLNHKHGVPNLTRSLERVQLGLKELA